MKKIAFLLFMIFNAHYAMADCQTLFQWGTNSFNRGLAHHNTAKEHYQNATRQYNANEVSEACKSLLQSYNYFTVSRLEYIACQSHFKWASELCTQENASAASRNAETCQNNGDVGEQNINTIVGLHEKYCTESDEDDEDGEDGDDNSEER